MSALCNTSTTTMTMNKPPQMEHEPKQCDSHLGPHKFSLPFYYTIQWFCPSFIQSGGDGHHENGHSMLIHTSRRTKQQGNNEQKWEQQLHREDAILRCTPHTPFLSACHTMLTSPHPATSNKMMQRHPGNQHPHAYDLPMGWIWVHCEGARREPVLQHPSPITTSTRS